MYESQDLSPILNAMRMGIDYRHTVTCRGFTVSVRPLSIHEMTIVASRVIEAMKSAPETARHALNENLILAKETLKLASTTEYGSNDPKLTDYEMDRWTSDELQYIYRQYFQGCDKVNPVLEKISVEDLKILVDQIKKKDLQLIELSLLQLINVCQFLIQGE